jgi:hypothetical protein
VDIFTESGRGGRGESIFWSLRSLYKLTREKERRAIRFYNDFYNDLLLVVPPRRIKLFRTEPYTAMGIRQKIDAPVSIKTDYQQTTNDKQLSKLSILLIR